MQALSAMTGKMSDAAGDAFDATKDAAGDAFDATKDAAGDAFDATKEAAERAADAADEIADAAEAAADAAKEKAAQAKQLAELAKHKGAEQARVQLANAIKAAGAVETYADQSMLDAQKIANGGVGQLAGNVEAVKAAVISIVVVVCLFICMGSDDWAGWTLDDYDRGGLQGDCSIITQCTYCDLQAACGWCGGADGGGVCMRGEARGPGGMTGVQPELCAGNSSEWIFIISQCPGMQGRGFGLFVSSYTQLEYPGGLVSEQIQRVSRTAGIFDGIPEEPEEEQIGTRLSGGEGACAMYARQNGVDTIDAALCKRKLKTDKDQCHALLALCGDAGQHLRGCHIAAIVLSILVVPICSSVNRKACLPKGKTQAWYRHRLQGRCAMAALLNVISAILLAQIASGWLPIYTALVLTFGMPYCADSTCPHLGTTFFFIPFSMLTSFYSASVITKQAQDLKLPGTRAKQTLAAHGERGVFEQEQFETMSTRWPNEKQKAANKAKLAADKKLSEAAANVQTEEKAHSSLFNAVHEGMHLGAGVGAGVARQLHLMRPSGAASPAAGDAPAGHSESGGGVGGAEEGGVQQQQSQPQQGTGAYQGTTPATLSPAAGTPPAGMGRTGKSPEAEAADTGQKRRPRRRRESAIGEETQLAERKIVV